ncbi:MAG: N-acetylglucosamine kinase, partial [Chitinophagia bacterium]|nr:N-acetylglucosamine kinase [Chitinophagia bacterium]
MARIKLIADAGSTKVEWCLVEGKKKKIVRTSGISPYFLSKADIQSLIKKELASRVDLSSVDEIY